MRKPPDQQRLHILIQLREQAGISQTEMARLCGFSGSTSRRSVAAWEVGEATPRARHRLPFMRYLLDGLHLRDEPELFAKVWEILVEEWLWDPISDEEWQANVEPDKDALTPYLVSQLEEAKTSDAENASSNDPSSAGGATTDGQASRPQQQAPEGSRFTLPAIAAVAVILLLTIAFGLWWSRSASKAPLYTPYNLGFEDASFAPWVAQDEGACDLFTVNDPEFAGEGSQFLHLQKRTEDCLSLRQDKTVLPALNAKHSFVVWVRSPDDRPRTGTLVLWQSMAPVEAAGHGVKENSEKAAVRFVANGEGWRCVEVSNHLQDDRYDVIRGEVYLDGGSGSDLLVDNASFLDGDAAGCPPSSNIQLLDNEHTENYASWQWSPEGCEYVFVEDASDAVDGRTYLAAVRASDECRSTQQRISTTVAQSQIVRGGIWARTPDEELRDFTVAVRSLDIGDEESHRFRAGPEWQCFEVAMETTEGGNTTLQLEIYFEEPADTHPTYHLDSAFLTSDPDVRCPQPSETIGNSGFENEDTLLPWDWNGTCHYEVVANGEQALEGERFLYVQREDERCTSFYQDMPVFESNEPAVFTAGIWARTTDATPRTAVLRLNQLGAPDHIASVHFSPSHEQWQCFETTLRVPYLTDQFVYFEVFPERIGDGGYFFDNAMLVAGDQHVCPQTNVGIRGLRTDSTDGRFFPGAAIAVNYDLVNAGPSDATQDHLIRAWVSESADGPPIAITEVAHLRIPPLAAGKGTKSARMDVAIPLHLSPGETYYVVVEADPNMANDGEEGLGRDSLSFDLTACYPDSLYCDVSLEHWARSEAEQWHEDGITSGCRSGTSPYADRPFCPDTAVNRDMFTVLVLRHLLGGDFQPPAEYAGHFVDVAEDARFVHWIEEAQNHGIHLPPERCPVDENSPRFCPNLPMTRRELALVLADLLGWDLENVERTDFGDIAADDPALVAVSFMWSEGMAGADDPHCRQVGDRAQFCPDEPLHRDSAAAMMARAFAMAAER